MTDTHRMLALKTDDPDLFFALQSAFDFFNYQYIDWPLAEQLSKKRQFETTEQKQVWRILVALCRHRRRVKRWIRP